MGRRSIPLTLVLAILAFAVAAGSFGFVPDRPRLWSAAVALIVLSGITPLIYAVNVRILPVFSRRTWRHPRWLEGMLAAGVASGWLVYAGRALPNRPVEITGQGLALLGGVLFVTNVVRLFRAPVTTNVAPPLPFPEQADIDRIGIRFTRLAALYLLFGLLVGFVTLFWTPEQGRWELIWAHTLLLGWFLMMASGILYHVLSRWTGARWRSVRRIRAHLVVVVVALPLMLLALAFDVAWLFAIAGPLQAIGLGLFAWNVLPLITGLPSLSRFGMRAAVWFLVIGVSIGASAAMDPASHARMRFSHTTINLLGWTGLLVCGVGYYLFPRLAGQPLRWPRLASAQVTGHAIGVSVLAIVWWWYLAVDSAVQPFLTLAALVIAVSYAVFAIIVAATFRQSRVAARAGAAATADAAPRQVVAPLTLQPRPQRQRPAQRE